MTTMRQARKMCPADPDKAIYTDDVRTLEDGSKVVVGKKIVKPRTLVEPFRVWARRRFASYSGLSPKLERIVRGPRNG
jgi:hypothetical protein